MMTRRAGALRRSSSLNLNLNLWSFVAFRYRLSVPTVARHPQATVGRPMPTSAWRRPWEKLYGSISNWLFAVGSLHNGTVFADPVRET